MRQARHADRPTLAGLDPASGADGHGHGIDAPVAKVEEEERGHDGRDRDAEDRAGDAGQLGADQDRAKDDYRVEAHRFGHETRLDDVHQHEPADDHDHHYRQHCIRLEEDGHEDRRQPGDEGSEERDCLQDARRGGRDRHVRQAQEQAGGHRDRAVDQARERLPAQEAAEGSGHAVLEQLGLIGVRGWDETEEEADDPVSVDRHV